MAELYAGGRVPERETLDTFLALFPIAPVEHELARLLGYCAATTARRMASVWPMLSSR
ncbi:MAG: hypothetical protein R3A10_01300 [Caldilineaceae bacterium]